MLEKLKDNFFKLKTYWNKPPLGYDVSYKEIAYFTIGSSSMAVLGVVTLWTTIALSTHMMISYFGMSPGLIWIIGIASAIVALVRAPIMSMIIDNHNSKNGKFKPFVLISSLLSGLFLTLIAFIPKAWNGIVLFNFNLPAIPVFGLSEPSSMGVSLAVLMVFVLLQIGQFFFTLLSQSLVGIEQTISTVAQERANIGAIKNLFSNLPPSIINIFIPILVVMTFFDTRGGWNSIELYRVIFPICSAFAVICGIFIAKGTHERVVVNKKYISKVKFIEGAKELSKNKYFWIISIFNILLVIRGYTNLAAWISQYSFTGTAKAIVGVYCASILQTALVLGNILGPILVKKLGKGKVILFSSIGFVAMAGLQLIFVKSPVMILIVMFLQQLFTGFNFMTTAMMSDSLDYQQWKTGKRLEGFWQNYFVVINTFATIVIGLLLTLFLSFGGIGMGDSNISEALQNPEIRAGAFKYQTMLAFFGSILCVIPMIFYDLSESKHANYVRALKIRAAVDNFNDNELLDKDVLDLKEIVDYSNSSNDPFIVEELQRHTVIDEILKSYDEVYQRDFERKQKEEAEELARNIELEEKKLQMFLTKAKEKAAKNANIMTEEEFINTYKAKNGDVLDEALNKAVYKARLSGKIVFDEEIITTNFKQKSRFLK